jgi:excisionase family DNA binding protein
MTDLNSGLSTPVRLGTTKQVKTATAATDCRAPLLLTVAETAELTRLNEETVRRLCRGRKLRCMKMGRLTRITPAAIDEWIRDAETPAKVQNRRPA